MQTRATHPKTARREAKSDKKKEERIGAQLMAEITDPPNQAAFAIISDPLWRPSSPHLQPTWAPQQERKCGGHGGDDDNPIAAAASEDPKRALVHALQNDLSRMLVQLERLDEMLSA